MEFLGNCWNSPRTPRTPRTVHGYGPRWQLLLRCWLELLLFGQSIMKRHRCASTRQELGKSSISYLCSINTKSIHNMINIGTTSFAGAACSSTLFTTSGKPFQSLYSSCQTLKRSHLLQLTASSHRQDSLILPKLCGSQLSSLRYFQS